MKILFDQGTPVPFRDHLANHQIETVFELGWSTLENGALLALADQSFDLFITTDQQLRYQQNLSGRTVRVAVLMTTSWPRIRAAVAQVVAIINEIKPGEYREIKLR